MNEPRRYLFLSFSCAFFVLTLSLLFLVTMVPPRSQQAASANAQAEEDYRPSPEDALCVLFISGERSGQEAGAFLLARFDPARGRVPIVPLPTDTLVDNGGRWEPLSEVYRYGGAEYTRDILAQTLQIDIDRYARVSQTAFLACAGAVGSVEFVLDRSVEVAGGGARMTLQQGVQLLDGTRIAALFSSDAYSAEDERSRLLGELAAEIVNQRRDICHSAVLDQVFSTIINQVDSDISSLDYHQRKQAGAYLADLEGEVGVSIAPAGSRDETGLRLSDTFVALVRQTFS